MWQEVAEPNHGIPYDRCLPRPPTTAPHGTGDLARARPGCASSANGLVAPQAEIENYVAYRRIPAEEQPAGGMPPHVLLAAFRPRHYRSAR